MTLYRQYRPTTFADVIGQSSAIKILQGIVTNKQLAPVLLVGSRGIGKTTLARIVARELGINAEDVYELDAASNRKIDDIRRLRDDVQTLPITSPYKAYILDEVHMLTNESWNALLKTLEEPPQFVFFVLATTEYDAIPDTIISRCQVVRLRQPVRNDLIECLDRVSQAEGFSIDSDAQDLLVTVADGSFRDLLSQLQSVRSSVSATTITGADVVAVLGAPPLGLVRDFLTAIIVQNTADAIAVLRQVDQSDYDPRLFTRLCVERVRWGMFARLQVSYEAGDMDSGLIATIAKTPHINAGTLAQLLQVYTDMKYATIPLAVLELWVYGQIQQEH